jgi:hypothetical protein
MSHLGDPALIRQTIQRFIAWRKKHHLHPSRYATLNILYNDPDTVAAQDFRLDLAVPLDADPGEALTASICKPSPRALREIADYRSRTRIYTRTGLAVPHMAACQRSAATGFSAVCGAYPLTPMCLSISRNSRFICLCRTEFFLFVRALYARTLCSYPHHPFTESRTFCRRPPDRYAELRI